MSSKNQNKVIHNIRTQIDSFGRKKYKLQEVAKEESDQQQNKKSSFIDTGKHKSMLIGRQQSLDIDKYIGKLDNNKKKKVTEVFFCQVCEEGFKCDMAYLTHLNSPAHNRKLGMNMKVKAVSIESVADKIKALNQKKFRKQANVKQEQILRNINPDNSDNQPKDASSQEDQNQKGSQVDIEGKIQEKVVKLQDQQQKDPQQEFQPSQDQKAQQQMMQLMGFSQAYGGKKQKR